MTVENNYVIAIATHSDWLKRLAPVFQAMRSKTKSTRTMSRDSSRALSELQGIARNCDWFIAVFAPVARCLILWWMYCTCLQHGCYHVFLWFLFNFFFQPGGKTILLGTQLGEMKEFNLMTGQVRKSFTSCIMVLIIIPLDIQFLPCFNLTGSAFFALPSTRKKRLTCAALKEQSPCAIVRRWERSWICDLCRSSFVFNFIKHENCTVVFNSA